MKHLNQQQKGTARLPIIHKYMWIKHYKELWTEENGETDDEEQPRLHTNRHVYKGDEITLDELKEALEQIKIEKLQVQIKHNCRTDQISCWNSEVCIS